MLNVFKRVKQLEENLQVVAEFEDYSRNKINQLIAERNLVLGHFGYTIITNKKGTTFLRKKRELKKTEPEVRVKRKYTKRKITS